MTRRTRYLGTLTTAIAGFGSTGTAWAQCSTVTPPGGPTTYVCATNTTTTNTTNTNPNNPATNARFQQFGTNIVGRVNPGVTVGGLGISVSGTGTSSVTFENNGAITSNGSTFTTDTALELRVSGGTLTYTGNGSVFAGDASEESEGVSLSSNDNGGNIQVGSAATPVSGTFRGRLSAFGISGTVGRQREVNAFFSGGSFTSPEGLGLIITNNGNVRLTMTGGTIIASGSFGLTAHVDAGDLNIVTDARISSPAARASVGIDARNFSNGDTNISLTPGASIFADDDGLAAVTSGDLNLITAAGTTIDTQAASNGPAYGIFAVIRIPQPNPADVTLDLSGSVAARNSGSGEAVGVLARATNGAIDVTVREGATIFGSTVGLRVTRGQGGSGTANILNLGTIEGPIAADFIGTLQVGNGGTTGTLIGNVIDNGTLVFNRSDNVTFGGAISGPGALRKTGAGSLVLTGNSSFTGVTTIDQGVLRIGNGGTSGAIVGNVVNNASLIFDRSDTLSFGGDISGTGVVRKTGAGTLVFTGAASHTGGTTIDSGTLQIGAGGTTGSIAGNIVDNGTLVFNRSDAITYGGVVSGTGSLTKTGAGTLTLSGTNTYTGATIVQQGTLLVTGSTTGATTVNGGASLGGTGRIGSGSFSGTVAPGTTGVGTLSTTGNVTFASGSTFQVQVNPDGTSDRLAVGGSAALQGGTVQSLFLGTEDNRCGAPLRSAILTAGGGVSGTFAGVTSNFAFLTPSLSYDANNVFLTLSRNSATFAERGATENQRASAAAAEALKCGNALFNPLVQLSATDARAAFEQISGEIHASTRGALLDDSRFLREAMLARRDGGRGIWASGYGSWGEIEGNGNAALLERESRGFFGGVDLPIGAGWSAGLGGGYSRADFTADARASQADIRSWHLGARFGGRAGGLGLGAGGAVSWHRIDTDRSAVFTGFSDSPTARYDGRTVQVFAQLGYEIPIGAATVEPFADLAWVDVDTDAFAETGGASALTGNEESDGAAFSTLGVRARAGMGPVSLTGSAGWRHAFSLDPSEATFTFAGGNAPFTVVGAPIAEDALALEAGLEVGIGNSGRLGISYVGQLGGRSEDHGARAVLRLPF